MSRSVTRGYYGGSAGALVFFDLSHRGSFENVGRWLQDVRSVARADIVFVLFGGKADLGDRRQVQWDEAQDFAQRYGMKYFEASAKTGVGVSEAVNCCVALIGGGGGALDAGSGARQPRDGTGPPGEPRTGCY
jgi:GTPase SAR1 family protein